MNRLGGPRVWTARFAIVSGIGVLTWLYPLTLIGPVQKVHGEICVEKYGTPQEFTDLGLQPEQVAVGREWSWVPPGWACTFGAYQNSDLRAITFEPEAWRLWLVGAAGVVVTGGCLLGAPTLSTATRMKLQRRT